MFPPHTEAGRSPEGGHHQRQGRASALVRLALWVVHSGRGTGGVPAAGAAAQWFGGFARSGRGRRAHGRGGPHPRGWGGPHALRATPVRDQQRTRLRRVRPAGRPGATAHGRGRPPRRGEVGRGRLVHVRRLAATRRRRAPRRLVRLQRRALGAQRAPRRRPGGSHELRVRRQPRVLRGAARAARPALPSQDAHPGGGTQERVRRRPLEATGSGHPRRGHGGDGRPGRGIEHSPVPAEPPDGRRRRKRLDALRHRPRPGHHAHGSPLLAEPPRGEPLHAAGARDHPEGVPHRREGPGDRLHGLRGDRGAGQHRGPRSTAQPAVPARRRGAEGPALARVHPDPTRRRTARAISGPARGWGARRPPDRLPRVGRVPPRLRQARGTPQRAAAPTGRSAPRRRRLRAGHPRRGLYGEPRQRCRSTDAAADVLDRSSVPAAAQRPRRPRRAVRLRQDLESGPLRGGAPRGPLPHHRAAPRRPHLRRQPPDPDRPQEPLGHQLRHVRRPRRHCRPRSPRSPHQGVGPRRGRRRRDDLRNPLRCRRATSPSN